MVTVIGNTSSKITISDHATPGSAQYAWYFEAELVRGIYNLPWGSQMQGHYPTGISLGIKQYIADIGWDFARIRITNNTDYQNLLKALSYWEKNNSLLYLSVKNEWDSNLALWGTYDTPTTLTQLTGQITNLVFNRIDTQSVELLFSFKRVNKTTGA